MTENIMNDPELEKIVGGGPTPGPAPDPGSAPLGDVVERAKKELGKPYAWGGVGPDAYDASGFVSYCLTGTHALIGTAATFMSWPRVSNPTPGDVCVCSYHCGIYVGPNKMIHAPSAGAVVSYGAIQGDMIIVRR